MVNTTLKELLQRRMANQHVRRQLSYTLTPGQEHVITQICKPEFNRSSRIPGSQHIFVCWFQCYRKYPLSRHEGTGEPRSDENHAKSSAHMKTDRTIPRAPTWNRNESALCVVEVWIMQPRRRLRFIAVSDICNISHQFLNLNLRLILICCINKKN